MAIYHGVWDLSFLHLIATDIATDRAWTWFARAVAGSFLFLVGVSLVLAHGRGIRWQPFLRRAATIAVAAAIVTAGTYLAFPESYIFFGILHCIALSSVLALPFLRLHPLLVAAVAVLVLACPRSASLNAPVLAWLGLGTRVPVTNDYVPIFPWFGLVLLGVAAARALALDRGAIARWRPRRAGVLAWAGRHSLAIYLLHQPLLLAILYPLAWSAGPHPAAEAAPFLRSCERECITSGHAPATCRASCGCAVGLLRQHGLWTRAARDALTEAEQKDAGVFVRPCFPPQEARPRT
jgi:uncharacterized membrane protein